MKGEQHIFYTLLSAGILLSPVASIANAAGILVFLAASFVGSLSPDADSADSAIMHGVPGGTGKVRVFRRHTVLFLPLFGYLIRYLVYFPLSAVVLIITLGRVKPKHRGLLHSLFGVFFISVVVTLLFALLLYLFRAGELYGFIPVFWAGFLFGGLMHLVEDSCSKSGVFWLYPFSIAKVSGTLLAGGRRHLLIIAILGVGFAAVYVDEFTALFPQELPWAAPVIVLILAWTAVLIICRAKRS